MQNKYTALNNHHVKGYNAHSWDSIENRFITCFGGKHLKMLELVRHIKKSGLENRLFGVSSMDKLIISVYDKIDFRKEALHIQFDLSTNTWEFSYYALPFQEPEFVRNYSSEKGIEKFDQFIETIKW